MITAPKMVSHTSSYLNSNFLNVVVICSPFSFSKQLFSPSRVSHICVMSDYPCIPTMSVYVYVPYQLHLTIPIQSWSVSQDILLPPMILQTRTVLIATLISTILMHYQHIKQSVPQKTVSDHTHVAILYLRSTVAISIQPVIHQNITSCTIDRHLMPWHLPHYTN